MTRTLVAALVGVVALSVSPSAHHSFAAHYFEDQVVTIEGEVVEFEYRNPHAWVRVIARGDNGATQEFAAEWGSISRLKQWGVTEAALKPGDRVVITGSPGRNPDEHRIHLKSIQRPADGWKWSGPSGRS